MKKRIVLILLNVALTIILCVGNIIMWNLPYRRFSYEPYKAYYLTTEKNKYGEPIPHKTDCDCEYTRYKFGDLYYYDDQHSFSISGENKTFDILGTKLRVTYKETTKIEYTSGLNKVYENDNGTTIWCDAQSGVLTRYSAIASDVRISNDNITSEEMLKSIIASHIGQQVDLSQFKFDYCLKVSGYSEDFNFDEISDFKYSNGNIKIYATYSRYIDGVLTTENIKYTITLDGYLKYYSWEANNDFASVVDFKIDIDKCNSSIRTKLWAMTSNFVNKINRYDQSEYLAYIEGQYVLIAKISPHLVSADPITLAIPITDTPMPIINISPTVKTVISVSSAVLLSASITVSIIISRKKSAPIPTEEEQTE